MTSKARRAWVTVACWCIVIPVLPFHWIGAAAEGVRAFCEWAAVDRKWSTRLIDRAERLAARHGVEL